MSTMQNLPSNIFLGYNNIDSKNTNYNTIKTYYLWTASKMVSNNSVGRKKYLIFLLAFYSIFLYHNSYNSAVISQMSKHNAIPTKQLENRNIKKHKAYNKHAKSRTDVKLKYILQWTNSHSVPFKYMGVGQQVFIDNKCAYTNCYVTSNRHFFTNVTTFDAVAFTPEIVENFKKDDLPLIRAPHQKYVFVASEPSAETPVCRSAFNRYFNLTWTYKLDSDIRFGYLVVRDHKGTLIGPNKIMHWINHENMQPVSGDLKNILRGKTKTAAWFVSHCVTESNRAYYVKKLKEVLESKYNTTVDVFGTCGQLNCSINKKTSCDKLLRRDYYFYLSFENSFCEDYVTEKLLRALKYNAVPIVYGGANYSRFLPEHSYINAAELNHEDLADKMHELMTNFDKYVEYFRWTNHYYYHDTRESPETNDFCLMCKHLNKKKNSVRKIVYADFTHWWNKPYSVCLYNSKQYFKG